MLELQSGRPATKEGRLDKEIRIKIIDYEDRADINIPNEPFSLDGRMIPCYMNGKWSYSTELFEKPTEMTFPDEHYSYEEMQAGSVFIGAYDEDQCVGLAILQEGFFKYAYLYDLKVNKAYRGKGVGKKLIDKAEEIAGEKGYIGLYTQGQDNNLGACLFYLKCGFEIGGFDNRVYEGTKQEGKADIFFYKRSLENDAGETDK